MRIFRGQLRQTRFWVVSLAVSWIVSWLAACGPAPSITISTNVTDVDVVRGATVDLTVTVVRTGAATADVQLAVTNLPSDVDATFAPAVLSGPTLESTLTLAVDATAAEGTHDVTVTAVGPGLAAEATFALTVSSLDVTGTVLLPSGKPWGGVEVTGPTGSTTTADDGTFTLQDLAVPYDVALHSDEGTDWVHVFEGLFTGNPEFEPYTAALVVFVADTANLSGTLSGPAMPLPANHAARVCLEGLDRIVWSCQALGAGEDTYDLFVIWPDLGTLAARLHVLAYELNGAGDAPASYVGYASADVVLSNGDATVLDMALSGVATSTLQGEIVVEGGGSPDRLYAGLRFGPYLTIPLFRDGSGANTFALPMPDLPGASYDVAAVVGTPMRWAWKTDLPADAGTLTIPEAPTLLAPADAALGIDLTTAFEVTAASPGAMTYVWDGSAGAPTFALTTSRSSASIPDGSAHGIPLPGGTDYEWSVFQVPLVEVDDAARVGYGTAYGALDMMGNQLGGPGFDGEGAIASSALRSFTSAP